MPRLSASELATRSDVVVRAKVVSQNVTAPSGPRSIATHTRLHVLEALKGKPPVDIEAVQVGGTWGPYTLLLPGGAKLEVGEEAVLFLRCPRPACAIVGLSLGKYRVTNDPRTGKRRVQREVPGEAPRDLDDLTAEVRRIGR